MEYFNPNTGQYVRSENVYFRGKGSPYLLEVKDGQKIMTRIALERRNSSQ